MHLVSLVSKNRSIEDVELKNLLVIKEDTDYNVYFVPSQKIKLLAF